MGIDGPEELRPSTTAYLQGLRARAWGLTPFLLLGVARVLLESRTWAGFGVRLAALVAVAGGALLLARLHLRTSVVRLLPDRVERTGLLVRDVSIPVEGARGVLAPLRQPLTAPVDTLLLVPPSAGGRRGPRLRLHGGVWSHRALGTIADHAGLPVVDGPLRGRDIERLVPGALPWRLRRPWVFGTLVAVGTVAAITAGVLGWYAWRDLPPFDDRGPRQASAATLRSQDDLLDDVAAALGGRWSRRAADLVACEVDDRKGWARWVVTERTAGPDVAEATLDAVNNVLVDHGFHEADFADPRDVSTVTDGWDEVTYVSFDVDGPFVAVELRGPCEA